MYDEKLEGLISAALADGVLTEKEKQILFKKAQAMGIDLDEFEMVLDARLVELEKAEKEKAAKSAPKSDKYGTVRKCPACGAIVPAFQGVCPECGHEFMDVDANASSKKLAEALLNEKSETKQKQIIETFPIPNTKADLLEFLTALKPRVLDTNDTLAKAYFKKYQECIEKAKVSFPNDKLIAPFITEHESVQKAFARAEIAAALKQTTVNVGSGIGNVIKRIPKFLEWLSFHFIEVGIGLALVLLFGWIGTCCIKDAVHESQTNRFATKLERVMSSPSASDDEIIAFLKKKDGKSMPIANIESLIENKYYRAAMYYYDHNMDTEVMGADDARKHLYLALIDAEMMEDATRYYGHAGGTHDYNGWPPSNRAHYCEDVVASYCKHGHKDEAKAFIEAQMGWFKVNVDADSSVAENQYPKKEYNSKEMLKKLNLIVENY